ncbi:manganese efflux pump [Gluconacetobacter azotocaptans]|uniref:Putative manganese efflux pump MntP n=1 Tax=Gluconacetobacter azotocaptans TaxID=142834 RepID=A0A7W4PGN8_9PROT|nr:manganese efflux pump MntP family protein [Gluconacetobacter azotocaptans]MBB2190186.1 manganese efflux pump [Gluconacetobacter azotocaptans]
MTGVITLGALGAGLSVDAFAAAVGKGAATRRSAWIHALRVGAVFGVFEAITPAIGWSIGLALSNRIAAVDHWIAFFLLLGVGVHMIHAAMTNEASQDASPDKTHTPLRLAATALATSIDATAVGVSLAVMQVNIVTACLVIGGVTTVVATLGVMLGRHASAYIGRYAEILGGVALIVVGASILYQHLTA